MPRIMLIRIVVLAGLSISLDVVCPGQELKPRPADSNANAITTSQTPQETPVVTEPVVVPMTVGTGSPIKVALDEEVRVRKVGQPIHGKTTEPVYAFDKLLIPIGTVVNGRVSAIDLVSKKLRIMQATDGNF